VTLQILFIPHGMLPKPALPDPAFTLRPHKRSGANLKRLTSAANVSASLNEVRVHCSAG
jgi:hypothetical protein